MYVSFDYFHNLEDVEFYLCNPDGRELFSIDAVNRNVILRFNDLSELSFDYYSTASSYDNEIINLEAYEYLQVRRLVFVTHIGWFVITNVTEHDDGVAPYKSVTCSSLQTRFNDKGIVSEERVYYFYNPADPKDEHYNAEDESQIPSVVGQLYQQAGVQIDLSSTRTTPAEPYDEWTITYINGNLYSSARTFDSNTHTAYEWMINTVGDAYEACFLFDYYNKAIQVVLPSELSATSNRANVLFSFGNFMKNIEISEESENLVTVLDVTGENCDITNVNPMGTNYICNFDYYMDKTNWRWMSSELITVLEAWKANLSSNRGTYRDLVAQLRELNVQLTSTTDNLQYYSVKLTDLKNARDKKITINASDGNTPITPDTTTLYGIIAGETIGEENIWDEKWEPGDIDSLGKNTDSTATCRGVEYIPVTPLETLHFSIVPSATIKINYYSSSKVGMLYGNTSGSDIQIPNDVYFIRVVYPSPTYNYSVCIYRNSGDHAEYNSLMPNSPYYSNSFLRFSQITAYENPPQFDETDRTWSFSGQSYTTDTATNLVNASTPKLYFIDVTSGDYAYKSYCKLTPKSVVHNNNVYTYCGGFERYAAYDELPYWIDTFESYVNEKNDDISNPTTGLEKQIADKKAALQAIADSTNIISYVRAQQDWRNLLKELYCYWIEGSYVNDNICVEDGTPFEEELDLEAELMTSGETELVRVSQPKLSFGLDAVDYLSQYEFRDQADALELGKIITVEHKEGVWYYPFLLEISMSLDNRESFGLKFSNALKLTDWNFTYAELLFDASSVTRQVGANWQNLMQYTNDRPEIGSLVRDPLSSTLRAAFANMKNQKFTTDDTGILGRKIENETTGTFSKKQIRILNNVILFTDDNWQTVKTALGEITDGQNTTYGLVAETIIGSLILGNTLNIENSNSSVVLDASGITITNGSSTVFSADTSGNVIISGSSDWRGNKTFRGSRPLTGMITGDLWIDSDDIMYRYNGSDWIEVSDARLLESTQDAQTVYYLVYTTNPSIAGVAPNPPQDSQGRARWVDPTTPPTTSANVWTTAMPSPIKNEPDASTPKYAIYYTCIQTKDVNGTVHNGPVVEQSADQAILDWCATSDTTKIDGGTIYTNSIYANSLNTNSIVTSLLTVKESASPSAYTIFCANPSGSSVGGVPAYSVKIGGFTVNSYVLFSGSTLGGSNTFIASSDVAWPTAIAGHTANDWLLKIGSWFGVESDGSLWCTNGHFSGTLESTQLLVKKTYPNESTEYTIFDINTSASTPYVELSGFTFGLTSDTSLGRKGKRCMYTNGRTQIDQMNYTGLYIGEDGISIRGPGGTGYSDSYMILDVVTGTFNFKGNLVATTGTFSGELSAAYGHFGGQGSTYDWYIAPGGDDSTTSCIFLQNAFNKSWFAGSAGIGPSDASCVYLGGDGFSLWYPSPATDYCSSVRPGVMLVQMNDGTISVPRYKGVFTYYEGIYFYCQSRSPLYTSRSGAGIQTALAMFIDTSYNVVLLNGNGLDANGKITNLSDMRFKNTISDISDAYDILFDNLKPSTFKYNEGTSNRLHTGYIAQNVKESIDKSELTTQDFAAYVDYELKGEKLALRYEEFVPLNTWQIQKLKHRVTELEARVAELETAINGQSVTQNIR